MAIKQMRKQCVPGALSPPCLGTRLGVVLHNQAVEHNVAMFSELSLAVRWQERLKQRLVLRVIALI